MSDKDVGGDYGIAWIMGIVGIAVLIILGKYGTAALVGFVGFSLLYKMGMSLGFEPRKGILEISSMHYSTALV